MAARVQRSPWVRRRRGVSSILFFEYDDDNGLQALTIRMQDWFEGRDRDSLSGEEFIIVTLYGVNSADVANLAKVEFVTIDGRTHNRVGDRPPEGANSRPDYVMRFGANVVSV